MSQIRKPSRHLQKRLQERNVQLEQMVEALRQRGAELEAQNAELDAFAHTVAHDLKNPLGILIGYSEMALERKTTQFTEQDLDDSLSKIAAGGRKMTNIINELLLLASVRKVDEVETVALDMGRIVAEAQSRLSAVVASSQAEICAPAQWPAALGYGAWVEEVWANHISNAIKYGGAPPKIELGATEQADGMVRFWVRDNGPGLTPEQQSRLFTQFTRLHQIRAEGHGLGLSIVQRIVEKLHGEVGVESEPGHGSLFYFTLPGQREAAAE